jgi:hypothetical protein
MGDLPWLLDLDETVNRTCVNGGLATRWCTANRIHTALTGIRFAAWYHGRLVQPAAALDKNRE